MIGHYRRRPISLVGVRRSRVTITGGLLITYGRRLAAFFHLSQARPLQRYLTEMEICSHRPTLERFAKKKNACRSCRATRGGDSPFRVKEGVSASRASGMVADRRNMWKIRQIRPFSPERRTEKTSQSIILSESGAKRFIFPVGPFEGS